MQRGLVILRTPAYRLAGSSLTVAGLLWVPSGFRLGNPSMVVIGLLTASYPISTRLYMVSLARKLDRAERANLDLAQRPDLYLVPSTGVDCISI